MFYILICGRDASSKGDHKEVKSPSYDEQSNTRSALNPPESITAKTSSVGRSQPAPVLHQQQPWAFLEGPLALRTHSSSPLSLGPSGPPVPWGQRDRSPLPSQHRGARGGPRLEPLPSAPHPAAWSGGPDPNPDCYLGLDDLLWEVAHGVRQPAFQALGKIADGLCQGTWGTRVLTVRKAVLPVTISSRVRGAHMPWK